MRIADAVSLGTGRTGQASDWARSFGPRKPKGSFGARSADARPAREPRRGAAAPEGREPRSFGDRKVYSVVHLIYRSKNYEKQSKDYEFSAASMRDHWQAGYNDTVRSLRHPEALQRPTDLSGVATFDLGVGARD